MPHLKAVGESTNGSGNNNIFETKTLFMKTVFTFFIICLFSYSSFAQPGTLDSSFGDSGKVISSFENYNTAQSVFIEQDQKIIVVGGCSSGGIAVRYKTDGGIDSSFGNNGIFITENLQAGYKVTGVLDKDEKIILAGTYDNELRTIRLLNSGHIDSSYGEKGIASIANTESFVTANVAIQNDYKITVTASNYYNGIVAARWLSNGMPDSSFGIAAISEAVTSEDYGTTFVNTIAITPNNKIVVAGALRGEYTSFITIRFSNNGFLDTTFNKTGFNIDPLNEYESLYYPEGAYSCAIQPDGKTIVAGTSTLNTLHGIGFVLIRYNEDGSPDKTFAVGGVLQVNINNGPSACNAIVLQKDGKIIAAGAQNTNFLLTRFTSSGITDTTFGDLDFTTSTDFGNDEAPYAIALQANAKVVLAGGASHYGSFSDILLARYNNNDISKKQIIQKIKHYAATHNNAQATSLNNVSIYPNPAQNVLHVAGLSSNKTKLTVLDFSGNIIRQLVANTSSYNLNLAALTPGNYLLKIEMNDAVVTKKFVKE